jgi:hypothetical protein
MSELILITMEMDLEQAEIFDLIFLYIKHKENCDFGMIWHDNKALLHKIRIDEEKLKDILRFLEEDKKINVSSKLQYSLSPVAISFSGFQIELYKRKASERKDKKKSRLDLTLRIIPIICTITFGVLAVYFNVLNMSKDKQLDERKRIIDSLSNIVDLKSPSVIHTQKK